MPAVSLGSETSLEQDGIRQNTVGTKVLGNLELTAGLGFVVLLAKIPFLILWGFFRRNTIDKQIEQLVTSVVHWVISIGFKAMQQPFTELSIR